VPVDHPDPPPVDSVHEPVPGADGVVRRGLRDVLARWGLSDDAVEDALLVVSELVANVVDHAATPFRLVVRLTGSVLHIAVADRSVRPPVTRPFDPLAARGRGMQVVAVLAHRWGYDTNEGGKVVWAELAV
jgi:anti-sigma regulatory factor (Ser/Thr protein kinase)